MVAATTELGHAGVIPMSVSSPGVQQWLDAPVEEVADLTWPFFVRTIDRISNDSKVSSSLRAMFLPILGADWRVNPRRARPEVVEALADDLNLPILGDDDRQPQRTRDRFDWPFFLRHALESRRYGFMPFEQVYRVDPGGMFRIRKLAVRMPHTIRDIRVARDGGLEAVIQEPAPGQLGAQLAGGIAIPVDRLVMFVHERRGYRWHGTSLLRSVYREWLLKDHAHRIAAIAMDRNSVGVPIYTSADPDKVEDPQAEAAAGQRLAESYRAGEAAGGRVPHGALLDLKGVQGQVFPLLDWVHYFDAQIAGNVLEHFSSLPSAPNGSRALGTSLIDFFVRGLNAHAEDVATTISAHVVDDWVDANFGESEPSPAVECGEIGADQQLTAVAIKQLIDAKAITPDPALERYLRRYWHLPAIELGDDVEAAGPLPADELAARATAVGTFIRSGFTPSSSLEVAGLPPVEHTGLLPVTVQTTTADVGGSAAEGGGPAGPDDAAEAA